MISRAGGKISCAGVTERLLLLHKNGKCKRTQHKVSERQMSRAWCVRLLHCSGCGSTLEMRHQRYIPVCNGLQTLWHEASRITPKCHPQESQEKHSACYPCIQARQKREVIFTNHVPEDFSLLGKMCRNKRISLCLASSCLKKSRPSFDGDIPPTAQLPCVRMLCAYLVSF